MHYYSKNLYSKAELETAYIELIKDFQPDYFLTLVTNQAQSAAFMKDKTKTFLAYANRKLVGRRWDKKPANELINGLCMIEKVNVNVHVHALVKLPSKLIAARLCFPAVWNRICPSGSVKLQEIYDLDPLAHYVLKESVQTGFFDEQVFLTSQFSSY